jgi:phage-related protein
VYTVRITDRVFVLHAFQKKAKSGIATPTSEIELLKQRLKQGVEISRKKEETMARKNYHRRKRQPDRGYETRLAATTCGLHYLRSSCS